MCIQVIELLGQENVKIQPDQMTKIITLIRQEDKIEQEEKEQKQKEKTVKQQQKAMEDEADAEALKGHKDEILQDKAKVLSTETPSGKSGTTAEEERKRQEQQNH